VNVIAAIVAAGCAAKGFHAGVRWYMSPANQFRRQLRDKPRRSLAELPEGTAARIVGRAEALDDTLEAPLTGRRCLYYTAIVEVSDGKDWREIIREDRAVMFVLDDGSARAIIDPSASKVALEFDGNSDSGVLDNPNEREQAFLDAHATAGKRRIFNRSLRYREAVIEVGETIAIFGAAVREPDPAGKPEAAYRGAAPTRLLMTSSRKQPMIISDSPAATR
jgi:hypothetical protein